MSNTVSKARRAPLLLALGLLGCPGPGAVPPPRASSDAAPRAALQAFVAAQQAGDYAKAYGLLAAPLRARYTPERLQSDYVRDHELADDKLSRVRAALSAQVPMVVHGTQAELPLGPDHAVKLVDEAGAWHVAALE
jgi:hypothetical protein